MFQPFLDFFVCAKRRPRIVSASSSAPVSLAISCSSPPRSSPSPQSRKNPHSPPDVAPYSLLDLPTGLQERVQSFLRAQELAALSCVCRAASTEWISQQSWKQAALGETEEDPDALFNCSSEAKLRVQKESEELLTEEREGKKEMQDTLRRLETQFDEELRREVDREVRIIGEQMEARIRVVEERVDADHDRLDELKKRQADTEKRQAELEKRQAELEKRQAGTEKNVTDLRESVAASNARIRALEANQSTLQANVLADAKRQIRAHEARASILQADIARFRRGSGLASNALDFVCSSSSVFWIILLPISLLTGKISTWLAGWLPPAADLPDPKHAGVGVAQEEKRTEEGKHGQEEKRTEGKVGRKKHKKKSGRRKHKKKLQRTEEERGSVSVGNNSGSGSGEEDTAEDAAFRGCGMY